MLANIHIAKTGGTTLQQMLRSSFGAKHCDVEPWLGKKVGLALSNDDLQRVLKAHPSLSSIAGHNIMGTCAFKKIVPDIQFFSIIRDPVKRCASEFQYQTETKGKSWEFNEWINSKHANDQHSRYFCGEANAEKAIEIIKRENIFVGLLDRFDESIFLLKHLYEPELNLGYTHVKVASSNNKSTSLLENEETRAKIEAANKEDIKLYDYVSNILFPSYIQRFDGDFQQAIDDLKANRAGFNKKRLITNLIYRNLIYKPVLNTWRLFH